MLGLGRGLLKSAILGRFLLDSARTLRSQLALMR